MKKKLSAEIGILLSALFVCLWPAAAALAQKPTVKPVGQVVVVDSKAKIVGHAMGGLGVNFLTAVGDQPFEPTVLLQVDEHLVAVHVARNRLFGRTVYFESENCQGTPWLFASPSIESLLSLVGIAPPGNTLYLPPATVVSQQITVRSFLSSGTCNSLSFSFTTNAVPGEPLINLDTVYTPPFSVRAIP